MGRKPVRDFNFKKFSVSQDKATHKVGTDGVLLGAWVSVHDKHHILDIGTGSGVIALMLAQRSNNDALIDAIEIQHQDAEQAKINFDRSSWSNRLAIHESALQDFHPLKQYDLIVSNPPFFVNSSHPPEGKRKTVRHTETLTFDELLQGVNRLLKAGGIFALILPPVESALFLEKAKTFNLHCCRKCNFKSRDDKPIERVMFEFSRQQINTLIEQLTLYQNAEEWSDEYKRLTRDFYLKI